MAPLLAKEGLGEVGLWNEFTVTEVFNRREHKDRRRALRHEMPRAEVVLWSRLRGRQLAGAKFRRQFGVGPYVVDFYAPSAKSAIEVDGDSHYGDGAEGRDARRDAYIESFGIRVLRCTNEDVYQRMEAVLEAIVAALQEATKE